MKKITFSKITTLQLLTEIKMVLVLASQNFSRLIFCTLFVYLLVCCSTDKFFIMLKGQPPGNVNHCELLLWFWHNKSTSAKSIIFNNFLVIAEKYLVKQSVDEYMEIRLFWEHYCDLSYPGHRFDFCVDTLN